jgi:hypothetical protein
VDETSENGSAVHERPALCERKIIEARNSGGGGEECKVNVWMKDR